jgi:N6-adenosine-specific RNA methylase IME4
MHCTHQPKLGYPKTELFSSLLVCTHGSCTPDVDEKLTSIQRVERTGRHSEKPEEFRHLVDTLYPHGPRIELFAREEHEGWVCWGNEVEATA